MVFERGRGWKAIGLPDSIFTGETVSATEPGLCTSGWPSPSKMIKSSSLCLAKALGPPPQAGGGPRTFMRRSQGGGSPGRMPMASHVSWLSLPVWKPMRGKKVDAETSETSKTNSGQRRLRTWGQPDKLAGFGQEVARGGATSRAPLGPTCSSARSLRGLRPGWDGTGASRRGEGDHHRMLLWPEQSAHCPGDPCTAPGCGCT